MTARDPDVVLAACRAAPRDHGPHYVNTRFWRFEPLTPPHLHGTALALFLLAWPSVQYHDRLPRARCRRCGAELDAVEGTFKTLERSTTAELSGQ